ncbi:MAG: guanylate kinase [Lachnospiraceae bacterium]|nr:guanylate kinase [Lachnospiraceae bacterium]
MTMNKTISSMRSKKGILVVVSGFSGAGKGTVMKRLLQKYDNYALSISMATRSPRPGEVDGRDYFFVSRDAFEEKIAEGGFVEYAQYCGNYYGTPKAYVEQQLEAGKDVILEIEIQGALKIKEKFETALLVFVMPPSVEELERRLIGRGTETPEVIRQRLSRADEEAEGIENYDYIVINNQLDACVEELNQLIITAHNAPIRNKEFIQSIKEDLKQLSKGE